MTVRFRSYTKKDGSPEDGVYAVLEHLNGLTEKDIVVRIDYYKKKDWSLDETDFFFPSLKISHLELNKVDASGSTFEATFDTKNPRSVFALLATMAGTGNGGHSYEMSIGKEVFYIDGDGADYIESINGTKLRGDILDKRGEWPKVYNQDIEKKEYSTIVNEDTLREIVSDSIKRFLEEAKQPKSMEIKKV